MKKSIAFLAILFLLLIISAGFIARSYILRRRYQRRLEDAMGPGQLLATPRAQGSKIKRLGTLPKITNAWLAEGGDRWNQMMVSFIFLLIVILIPLKLMVLFASLANFCSAGLRQT
jgi:hypothetical protein